MVNGPDSREQKESYPDTDPGASSQTTVVKKKKKKQCTCKGFSSTKNLKKEKSQNYDLKPWFREQYAWRRHIRYHTRDLKKVLPLVDDKPPKLTVPGVYDAEVLGQVRETLKNYFDVNQLLVKSLHEINIFPGLTDTFKYNYARPQYTNYLERKAKTKAIERQNMLMSKVILNPGSCMKTAKQYAEEWKRMEMVMENTSQFPLFWKVKKEEKSPVEIMPPPPNVRQLVTEKSSKYSDKRPRVYFEIAIANVGIVGRMVAMLYSDYVPMTVKNFLAFCNPKGALTYKGNLFYLIFQNYYCLTGDVVENRGYGGTSIYGPYFGNEDVTLKHGCRGMLTMYQKLPNRNDSQFLITFRKLESLDGQSVAFGKIVKGLHVLDAIESVGSQKTGRPKVEIYISDCDEI